MRVTIGFDLMTQFLSRTTQSSFDAALTDSHSGRQLGDRTPFEVESAQQLQLQRRKLRHRSLHQRLALGTFIAFRCWSGKRVA